MLNHALIVLTLLWPEEDFQCTLTIVTMAGWDTHCNSGNMGGIMGVKNRLTGIDAGPDWWRPVSDCLYISTADGGGAVRHTASVTAREL